MTKPRKVASPIRELLQFPLMQAIFGRRARRFALGIEIPSGPLAFKSRHSPMPLSDLEQAVLVAAATGVTGWNFGITHTTSRPEEFAHYTVRADARLRPAPGSVHQRSSTPTTTGSISPTCATRSPCGSASSRAKEMPNGYWPYAASTL